jgi:hypothetical protein
MTKHKLLTVVMLCFLSQKVAAQIRVSDNHRYLAFPDGKPFFWLGDTDWELFHRLTREEAEEFLDVRKQQGFTVIQAVALAEFNGLRQPNRYGDLPLVEEDPTKLAITPGNNPLNKDEYDYWDHVDFVISKAAEKGLFIGLLPTWGDKVAHLWGDGPIVFTEQNAELYGRALAKRFASRKNILWILGGDRPAVYKATIDHVEKEFNDTGIWRAMAKGIEDVLGKDVFITYHPWGNALSSSQYIHHEPWLDMNSFQSGHGSKETPAWEWIARDLALTPLKPTLDMEPCYEDHPVNPWDGKWTRKRRGYFTAYDVRARIYRSVFAGACGVTYGHHHVWQFSNQELYEPINVGDTLIPWRKALQAEGAKQMQFVKNLMLSRPYFSRIADQALIISDKGTDYSSLIYATRDEQGTYAMIYLPQNKPVTINLALVTGSMKKIWWYDPRTGKAIAEKVLKKHTIEAFVPPASGKDWILVIDDASKNYDAPGITSDR